MIPWARFLVLGLVATAVFSCRGDSPSEPAAVANATPHEDTPNSAVEAATFAGIKLFSNVDDLVANHSAKEQILLTARDRDSYKQVMVIGLNGRRQAEPASVREYTALVFNDIVEVKFEADSSGQILTAHVSRVPSHSDSFQLEAETLAARLGPPTETNELKNTWCVDEPSLMCIDMWNATLKTVARRWGPEDDSP